jgi:hypothetical protein
MTFAFRAALTRPLSRGAPCASGADAQAQRTGAKRRSRTRSSLRVTASLRRAPQPQRALASPWPRRRRGCRSIAPAPSRPPLAVRRTPRRRVQQACRHPVAARLLARACAATHLSSRLCRSTPLLALRRRDASLRAPCTPCRATTTAASASMRRLSGPMAPSPAHRYALQRTRLALMRKTPLPAPGRALHAPRTPPPRPQRHRRIPGRSAATGLARTGLARCRAMRHTRMLRRRTMQRSSTAMRHSGPARRRRTAPSCRRRARRAASPMDRSLGALCQR